MKHAVSKNRVEFVDEAYINIDMDDIKGEKLLDAGFWCTLMHANLHI